MKIPFTAVPTEDLGRLLNGSHTEEWRQLSWQCGDVAADAVCAWASAREDGERQLRTIIAALLLFNKFGNEPRAMVLTMIGDVEPLFTAPEDWPEDPEGGTRNSLRPW